VKSFSKLGWIGLGNMGSRIAKRLRNAGYPLMVYNRDRSKAEELASQGAELAAKPVDPNRGDLKDLHRIQGCVPQNL